MGQEMRLQVICADSGHAGDCACETCDYWGVCYVLQSDALSLAF